MARNRYYWLKLKGDFFRQKEIKKLRRIAGGDTYTIIYLKLQLLSLENEGKIFFEHVEETLADEISLTIDEDVENVAVTLSFLEKTGLIELVEADEYLLPKVLECIGSESESAERVRRYRERRKEERSITSQCNGKTLHVTQRRERGEKENRDIVESESTSESDLPKEKNAGDVADAVDDESLTYLKKLYEDNIVHRSMQSNEQAKFLELIEQYGHDRVHEAIVAGAENQAGGINYIATVLHNGNSYSPEKWRAEHGL